MIVTARVRPSTEGISSPLAIQSLQSVDFVSDSNERQTFGFDRVFGQSTSQQDMFDFVKTHKFVDDAIAGINVSVIAYGLTGSGKSHTMFGNSNDNGLSSSSKECCHYSRLTSCHQFRASLTSCLLS